MPAFIQKIRQASRWVTLGLVASLFALSFSLGQPAYAGIVQDAASGMADRYIAADGSDLTAVAQCLPKQLSQASLARVLRESGNDFIEKVFDVKDNYSDYKIDDAEAEYLNCMNQKGVTPQVER
ncbi:MAG: hypothetical protein HC922_00545 [Leptolyngbyaceae cyanobacterium SM2_3_12]|nr:hypothetical protein [Leptolyngbyaceae cyanobacterium SM2_3_12]